MAPVIGRLPSHVLLLIALACAGGWSTTEAAILEAGSRKLLQGSGPSTPFGDPAPGTLVVTWSAVPAKHGPGFSGAEPPHPPPYQYDWFNLYQPGSGNVSLIFYATDAYVAGPGNQKTQLPSAGGCDLVTTEYPDFLSEINSCRGTFTVPANLAVSAVYFLLQAPDGLEFQVPTPLDYLQCAVPFFPTPNNVTGNYVNGSLEAVFGSGAMIPLTKNVDSRFPSTFTILEINSQPFTATGTLAFESINMRVKYDPPVQLNQGVTLDWVIVYPFCYFPSKEVTVQSVTTRTLVPTSTECPAVNGVNTNSCFNSGGTMHVCCINPGSCGPVTAEGNPTCANGQYYVFN